MDDMIAVVPREAAARIVRACRALMFLHWAAIAAAGYFIAVEMLRPGPHFAMWLLIGALSALGYLFLGTRCPRCAHPFFAEKPGFGLMFGRFKCVACGFDPTANENSDQPR